MVRSCQFWLKRVFVFLALSGAAVAHAYVLPSGAILRRLGERRADIQINSLKVDGTLVLYAGAAQSASAALGVSSPPNGLELEGTVFLKFSGRCRVEASSVETSKSAVAVSAQGRRRVEGFELPPLAVLVEQLCPLLATRHGGPHDIRATIERQLEALGVEYKKTSLARLMGKVAYVLGNPAEGQSQLWLYKDSFLPARIRFRDAKGTQWDVRMAGYTSPITGDWFPRTVEVFEGGERVLKFTALASDARARLDDRLF